MGALWTGLMDAFKVAFDVLYDFTGSYGLAIILVTIIIRLILWPLTYSQAVSARKMQELQPELQKLQKKYKNDKEKLNEATLKLWKENNVNPAAGCLPVLVQLPFLYAVFSVLRTYEFGDAGFLWIHNLSAPDPTLILPIAVAAATFWQTWVSTPSGGAQGPQKTMLYVMPLMIGYFSWQLPAGLGIYWVVSSLFSVLQQYLVPQGKKAAASAEGGKS